MLPFKVGAVVTCDDIRIEQNNKFILIGVYNGTIVVPAFPAVLGLCWWIQIFPEKLGRSDLEIRIIKDDGAVLLRAALGIDLSVEEWSAIALPQTPLQLQGAGHTKLQMKEKNETDWTTVVTFEVKVGPPVGSGPHQQSINIS